MKIRVIGALAISVFVVACDKSSSSSGSTAEPSTPPAAASSGGSAVSIGAGGVQVQANGNDVNIGKDGVHVQSASGTSVAIDKGGVVAEKPAAPTQTGAPPATGAGICGGNCT